MASRASKAAIVLAAATVGVALWWRKNPSPCPYSQRWAVELPHPVITRRRLLEILNPAPGERLLEVGPGPGYYTIEVAQSLEPGGQLDLLDIQPEMLEQVKSKVEAEGVTNVVASVGDAQKLPFEDNSFDGAFLVTVLGEIPDQDAALRELSRVIRPGGRVVLGEMCVDPHFVTLGSMQARAESFGFQFERMLGSRLAYFARLRIS